MRRRFALIVVAVVGFIIFYTATRGSSVPSVAVLECPADVTLGPVEAGQIGVARLTVRNGGGVPLDIADVRTTCSCAGLERRTAGTMQGRRRASCGLLAGSRFLSASSRNRLAFA
jgi:hypothetical protein